VRATLNGAALAFVDEGLGMPLVFIHGFPFNRRVWQKQLEVFRSGYRVLVPDLRGFGASGGAGGPLTMERMAEDLHRLLMERHTGPAVVIGHSMGGYVALALAREHPDLIRGLVLVASKAGPDSPAAAAARLALAERVRAEGSQAVLAALGPKLLAPRRADPRLEQALLEGLLPLDPEAAAGALAGMAERPDATPSLAALTMPALVVAGAEDALIPPRESERLAQGLPSANLVIIPGAGHVVAFEDPEAFDHALGTWLSRFELAPS
jgi:pimeloyl-ACP methyl ester carboxylesterase